MEGHADPVVPVLLGLVVLFVAAKVGGIFAGRLNQPAVLGELVFGILLGNLRIFGFRALDFIAQEEIFTILAGIGVVLLLFEVGLESSISELLGVGSVSAVVAVIGVVVPFALGCGVSYLFQPDKSLYIHAFVGATLCATSVGITARVFKDLGKLQTKEARIILGAAVIDDVLGLIILAVISGVIASVAAGHGSDDFSLMSMLWIAVKAIGFLVVSILVGGRIAPALFRFGARLKMEGMLLSLSLSFCFFLAWLASQVGLAPIVGAFAAGLIIDGAGFPKFFGHDEPSLEHLIFPLSKFFVPVFFVHMGMQVDLTTFSELSAILFGLALSFMAILGKQLCGFGIFGAENRGVDRLTIGIGMVPRGEVGLIFAVIGAGLSLDGRPVIDKPLYSAIVLMVMVTTMLTPPGLTWSLNRARRG
ncbi:MAG: cation:proton antiporter [Deltaproteobacteria bacterium]|nr:cation:proton antiporter [Deltaproteobacteria bacterium]